MIKCFLCFVLVSTLALPADPHIVEYFVEKLDSSFVFIVAGFVSYLAMYRTAKTIENNWSSKAILVLLVILFSYLVAWIPVVDSLRRSVVALFVLYLAIGLIASSLVEPRQCLKVYALTSVIQAAYCIIQSATSYGGMHSADLFRASGLSSSTIIVGFFLSAALPLAAFWFIEERRFTVGVVFFILALGLLATWSRGPIAGATIGSIYVVCRGQFKSNANLVRAVVVLTVASVCIAGFFARSSTQARVNSTNTSTVSRVNHWHGGLEFFWSHPLGAGPGNVELSVKNASSKGGPDRWRSTDPKNQAILFLASFGILGFLWFVVLVPLAVKRTIETRSYSHSGLAGVLITLAFVSLWDSPFFVSDRETLVGLFGLLTGILTRDHALGV